MSEPAKANEVMADRAGRRARAQIISIEKAVEDKAKQQATSKAILDDPFSDVYGDVSGIVKPPINPLELSMLWEQNTVLGQCIEAMSVNIEGFGHRFIPRVSKAEITPDIAKRMEVEENILTNFFNNCSIDPELSFTDLRDRKRRDQEAIGNAFWEVLKSPTGGLMGFNVLPGHTCRLTKLSEDPVEMEQKMLFHNADGSVQWKKRTVFRRIRLVIQQRGMSRVWFKMFGDPRIIDCRDGTVKDEKLEPQYRANEVIHFPCVWSGRTPYGLPRHAGNLFSCYGSRSAEEINYLTFENNNIPSMAVLVSNGMLTEGSISRVKEFIESQFIGKKNYSQFLLLESEPAGEGVANPGTMKLEIKPLTDVQHKDELFQEYDANNRKKLRGAFRLPPMYLGMVEDYNKATAQVSRQLADEQVFGPERTRFDTFMNRIILPELGVLYWEFKTNTADTTDNETLVRMLSVSEKTGGMTPAIARDVLSAIFSRDLGPVKNINPDEPYSIQLARAMQANAAPETKLSVPGEASDQRAESTAPTTLQKSADDLAALRERMEGFYHRAQNQLWSDVMGATENDVEPAPTPGA